MAKLGIEVEGRFKGLLTLFLDAGELTEDNEEKILSVLKRNLRIQQVYISDLENTLLLGVKKLKPFLKKLSDLVFITVETKHLGKAPLPFYLNIMLAVEHPSFWNLRPTDQVKFSQGQKVFAIPVESMYKTEPSDFVDDINITL
jgi:hypothetical protein